MTPETAFQIVNGAAPVAWIAMIAAPQSKLAQRIVLSGAFVAILAAVYALIIATHFNFEGCLLYTSPSPRDAHESRMPSSA